MAKNETSEDDQFLSPTSILYVNTARLQEQPGGGAGSGGSSSLSCGAIAGIAVGAAAVALAAAAGGWALLRRRRQQQRTAGGAGASEEGKGAAADATGPATMSCPSSLPLGPSGSSRTLDGGGTSPTLTVPGSCSTTSFAFHVERGFALRYATLVSPFAAMTPRTGPGVAAAGMGARPFASPFAAAAQARASPQAQPFAHSGSPPASLGSMAHSSLSWQYAQTPASGGLASLDGVPAVTSGADWTPTAGSSSGTVSASGSSSARMLPELQTHVTAVRQGLGDQAVLV